MADIVYARIGTTVKGAPAMVRVQVAVAWRHLAAVVKADMGVDLDTRIIQARGGAAASAGTHTDGAAIDVRVWSLTKAQRRRIVLLARECGFPASWDRAWPGNEHLHLGADIPGVWTRVSYQVAAVKAGYNGLGSGGRGGRDDGPKPSAWRNTTTGPEWARQKLAASGAASPGVPSTGDKPATTTPQEDIMTPEQEAGLKSHMESLFRALQSQGFDRAVRQEQALETWRVSINRTGGTTPVIQELANQTGQLTSLQAENKALRRALDAVAVGQGIDLKGLEDMMTRVLRDNPVEVKVTAEVV